MFKKKIIIFATAVLCLCTIYEVSSYSLAEVKSETGIRVTDSKDALIGIPETTNAGEAVINSSKDIGISIKNNMSNTIRITDIYGGRSGVKVFLQNTVSISSGDEAEVHVELQVDSTAADGSMETPLTYYAEWNGGSAEIYGDMILEITKPVEVVNSAQDIILNNDSIIESIIIGKPDKNYEIVDIKFPQDKYIKTNVQKAAIHDNKIFIPINITSMEPDFYQIPVELKLNSDGCISTIETEVYVNIKSQNSIGQVPENKESINEGNN